MLDLLKNVDRPVASHQKSVRKSPEWMKLAGSLYTLPEVACPRRELTAPVQRKHTHPHTQRKGEGEKERNREGTKIHYRDRQKYFQARWVAIDTPHGSPELAAITEKHTRPDWSSHPLDGERKQEEKRRRRRDQKTPEKTKWKREERRERDR